MRLNHAADRLLRAGPGAWPRDMPETDSPAPADRDRPDRVSAAGGVSLHAARVGRRLQGSVRLATRGADAAERPVARRLDVVAAAAQAGDDRIPDAVLDPEVPRPRLPREEGARERLGVDVRRVDRRLEIEAEHGVGQEDVQRPLVLL